MTTCSFRGLVAGAIAGLLVACDANDTDERNAADAARSERSQSSAGKDAGGADAGDAGVNTKTSTSRSRRTGAADSGAEPNPKDAASDGAPDAESPSSSKSDGKDATEGDEPADDSRGSETSQPRDSDDEPSDPKEDPQGDSEDSAEPADSETSKEEDEPADTSDPPTDDSSEGLPSACNADSAPQIPALALETVIESGDLDTLTYATQPPGSSDWYLSSQRGRITIVRDGQLLDTAFLDLRSEISLGAGFDQTSIGYDERGLNGLAFAPDYADSGLFYIAITPSAPDNPANPGLRQDHDQVLEYRRSEDDPDRAQTWPERSLVDLGSSPSLLGNIHNINTVVFGPDGCLYVGSGDGGSVSCGSAEPGAQQDIYRQYGKILRLDTHRDAPFGPNDNPYADQAGAETVLHYGVRNPFRLSFDRVTGDLYFGDVGQSTYEEFNFAPAWSKGLNFGWPVYEGEARCPGGPGSLRSGSTAEKPIFVANRNGNGPFRDYRAPVGGVVYRGSAIPELNGTYIFGDYYGQRLGALQQCDGQTSPLAVIRKNCDPNFPEPCLSSGRYFDELTAIVEGNDGEIYLVANGNSLLKVVRGS